jgi:hypothetical protein
MKPQEDVVQSIVSLDMCYHHNLARPKGGPRSKMGSKANRSGLVNRPLRGRLRLGLAMYLDRCVRLK